MARSDSSSNNAQHMLAACTGAASQRSSHRLIL